MAAPDIPAEVAKAAPGAIASFVALWWLPGTRMQRVASGIGGAGMSYYGGDYVSQISGVHFGPVAWLLGMFGMAVAHKIYEALRELDVGGRLGRLLDKWGL